MARTSACNNVTPPIVVRDLVYVPVAKVATSSIKLVLRRMLGMPDPKPWWLIHGTAWPRTRITNKMRWFTVVRNPYDRVASCFASKLNRDRFMDLREHDDVLERNMTFAEFVGALQHIDLTTANEHIRLQAAIVPEDRKVRVFRLEELDDLEEFLGEKIPRKNESGRDSTYTESTRKIVRKLYAEDFVRFNYDT